MTKRSLLVVAVLLAVIGLILGLLIGRRGTTPGGPPTRAKDIDAAIVLAQGATDCALTVLPGDDTAEKIEKHPGDWVNWTIINLCKVPVAITITRWKDKANGNARDPIDYPGSNGNSRKLDSHSNDELKLHILPNALNNGEQAVTFKYTVIFNFGNGDRELDPELIIRR